MNLKKFLGIAPRVDDYKDAECAAELIDKFKTNDPMGRVTLNLKVWSTRGDYGLPTERHVAEVKAPVESNVISSMLPNGNHAPVLDIDIPHRLVPSSTTGHSHLFLDIELTPAEYGVLLQALVRAGVVEKGYYESYRNLGFTCARMRQDKYKDVHFGVSPW